jgi:hypothetical protein
LEPPEPEPEPEEPSPEPSPEEREDSIEVDISEGDALTLLPWEVIITPDDFEQLITLIGERFSGNDLIPSTPGDVCLMPQLDIIIVDADGNQIPPSDFINPIEIRYNLSPEELAEIDNDPNRVVIRVYDPVLEVWIDLITEVNPDNSVSTFVNYTGRFAVCIIPEDELIPVVLPETGERIPIPVQLPDTAGDLEHLRWQERWWGMALLVLIAAGVAGLRLWLGRYANRVQ